MTSEHLPSGQEGFEEFYRARLPELVVLAHALAGPDDAYDVAQQALLTTSRRWGHVSELARPDAWTRRVCVELATSAWRRRLRALRPDRSPDGGEVLRVPERTERFWDQVRILPPRRARASALRLLDLDGDPDGDPSGDPSGAATGGTPQPHVDLTDAGSSVASLREAARALDPARGLADLADRRRRRTVRIVVVLVAVLALAAGTVALLAPAATDDEPGPDDPSGYGALVTNRSGEGTSGVVQVDSASGSETLTTLPDGTPLVNPVDVEVSPEGDVLALVGDDTLQVVGLGDNPTSTSVLCRRCLFVDWMGFKVGILLVTSYDADGGHTHVYANDGTERGALTMPEDIAPSGYSPDRLSMVGVENLGSGAEGRSRLFVLDDGTGERTPLDRTETAPGRFIYDASWSPDGVQVAYLEAGDYAAGGDVAAQDYRLMVASADGTDVHEVADLGRCYCVRMADPRFAWSPDGSSLLAVTVASQDSHDSSEVRVFGIDGSVQRTLPGGAPVDWGPPVP